MSAANSVKPPLAPEEEKVDPVISIRDFSYAYGSNEVLHNINLDIARHEVTALIGPSGCGKSTLLRSINRINDLVDSARVVKGSITLDGVDINSKEVNVISLRRRVGMIFQKYNPFPRSIYENVIYGLQVAGVKDKAALAEAAETSLRSAALWDEVKDRLHESALGLSGGQQQRLCIARTISVKPRVVLMDEPCAALDPIATARVEDLVQQLKTEYTIVIVTHNMEQARRVSDQTAFFYLGEVVEQSDTMSMFTKPKHERTASYIMGKMG